MNPLGSYKTIILGNTGVGKSSIIRYLYARTFSVYSDSTIGAAYYKHIHMIPSSNPPTSISYEIWDTAGQERYHSIIPLYLRGSSIVLLVYDVSDPHSFEDIKNYWTPFILKYSSEGDSLQNPDPSSRKLLGILIENKIDLLENSTLTNKAKIYLIFWQTSASLGKGIFELFDFISCNLPPVKPLQRLELPKPKPKPLSPIAEWFHKTKDFFSCFK